MRLIKSGCPHKRVSHFRLNLKFVPAGSGWLKQSVISSTGITCCTIVVHRLHFSSIYFQLLIHMILMKPWPLSPGVKFMGMKARGSADEEGDAVVSASRSGSICWVRRQRIIGRWWWRRQYSDIGVDLRHS